MKAGPVILSLIGIALLAFLMLSPVTPAEKPAMAAEETSAPVAAGEDPDAQVEEAVRMLQSGEVPPMEAILKIRDVAEKHPKNVKANFTLGALSIRSGQYQKAIERFTTVLEQQPNDGHAYRFLAEAQLGTGDTAGAKASFEKALQLVDDETGDHFKEELPQLSTN